MQTLNCNIRGWKIEAKLDEIEESKLMAIISATDESDEYHRESKHIVVLEHKPGCDQIEEVKELLERILNPAH